MTGRLILLALPLAALFACSGGVKAPEPCGGDKWKVKDKRLVWIS